MKLLNCLIVLFMIFTITFLLILMIGIYKDVQSIKEIINIETEAEETDRASDCLTFPCYTAKHKLLWVSQKYLTKGQL